MKKSFGEIYKSWLIYLIVEWEGAPRDILRWIRDGLLMFLGITIRILFICALPIAALLLAWVEYRRTNKVQEYDDL